MAKHLISAQRSHFRSMSVSLFLLDSTCFIRCVILILRSYPSLMCSNFAQKLHKYRSEQSSVTEN